MGPNNLQNEDDENTTESSDSDSNEMFSNEESANPSKKAKFICQFFYSSIEGDFHGQWLLFHYKKLTTKLFLLLYGKYICEAIGSLSYPMNPYALRACALGLLAMCLQT